MLNLSGLKRFEQDSRLMKRILFLEQEWMRACPDVDLQDQLGWAHYWVSTNSKGAKYRDMTRFLSNWFKNCQRDISERRAWNRRSGEDRRIPPKYVETKPPEDEIMTGDDFKKMREII